jgi:hypothetical protein
MGDRDMTVADVEREHDAAVEPKAHWAYLLGVMGVGMATMLVFIAWLGWA